ncbi:hypothetical protein SDC9_107446 [bioreactor metagenome]|uniref:Helix-turn-helix domain-containing protein n=1 Tax=bioreactor metagenome TaxID=1076179 RepID=A0A645BFU5_9ZZZZ
MEQKLNQEKLLLTVEDVAQLLSISRAKAYQLTHQDNFPIVKIGSCIRIYKNALIEWIENNSTTSNN